VSNGKGCIASGNGAIAELTILQSIHKFLTNQAAICLTLEPMKVFRHIITIVCIVSTFIAKAGEQLTGDAKKAANQPTAVELQLEPLQGTWEGVLVGDNEQTKITIKITGNSLHFYRDTNFWFETKFALPAGTAPQQLHATIENSAPPTNNIGQVVRAFFKIEDGTLTLATIGDGAEETPKGFEAAPTRYELRKVQPQKKNTQPP
jgi:uncharacterized protein (TIGR03067 family)